MSQIKNDFIKKTKIDDTFGKNGQIIPEKLIDDIIGENGQIIPEKLNKNFVESLTDDQKKYLFDKNILNVTIKNSDNEFWFKRKEFNDEYFNGISNENFIKLVNSDWFKETTIKQFNNLTASSIALLPTDFISEILAEVFGNMSKEKIAALTQPQVESLRVEQFENLSGEKLKFFFNSKFQWFTKTQLEYFFKESLLKKVFGNFYLFYHENLLQNMPNSQVESLTKETLQFLSEKDKAFLLVPYWQLNELIKANNNIISMLSKVKNQNSNEGLNKLFQELSKINEWKNKLKNNDLMNFQIIWNAYESLLSSLSDKELWYLINNKAINYRMYLTFSSKSDKVWPFEAAKLSEYRTPEIQNLSEKFLKDYFLDENDKIIPIKLVDNIAKSLSEDQLLFLLSKNIMNITVEKFSSLTNKDKFCFKPEIFINKCFEWFSKGKITAEQITQLSETSWFETILEQKNIKLDPKYISLLSPQFISKIPPSLFNKMSKAQIKALNQKQVESLTTEQVRGFKIEVLNILFDTKIEWFTQQQVDGLNDFLINKLTGSQLEKINQIRFKPLIKENKIVSPLKEETLGFVQDESFDNLPAQDHKLESEKSTNKTQLVEDFLPKEIVEPSAPPNPEDEKAEAEWLKNIQAEAEWLKNIQAEASNFAANPSSLIPPQKINSGLEDPMINFQGQAGNWPMFLKNFDPLTNNMIDLETEADNRPIDEKPFDPLIDNMIDLETEAANRQIDEKPVLESPSFLNVKKSASLEAKGNNKNKKHRSSKQLAFA